MILTPDEYIESFKRRDHEYGLPPFSQLPRWHRRSRAAKARPDLARMHHAIETGLLTMEEATQRDNLNHVLALGFLAAVAAAGSGE